MEENYQEFEYSKRSPRLCVAIFCAKDGLISTASLMMRVGAVKKDIKAMILTGFDGLIAGACSVAIDKLVSVYSQLDTELAQIRRDRRRVAAARGLVVEEGGDVLSNSLQDVATSAVSFCMGAMVPLLPALLISEYMARVMMVVAAVNAALLAFGWLWAVLVGRAPMMKAIRGLVGGSLAMAMTIRLTKLIISI